MKRQKKSIKNHCKDILLVIGASSVALASCSKPYVEGLTYDNFAENLDEGLSLIPIDVYLTDVEKKQAAFYTVFSSDILMNPSVAKDFINNPEKTLEKYGLEGLKIDVESPEMQIILALADDDIRECLQKGDFIGYLDILKNKNLLQTAQLKSVTNIIEKGGGEIRGEDDDKSLVAAVWAVAVVVYYGAIITTAAAAVAELVAVGAHVVFGVKFWVKPDHDDNNQPSNDKNISANNSSINFYLSKILSEDAIRIWYDESAYPYTYDYNDTVSNKVAEIVGMIGKNCEMKADEIKEMTNFAIGTIKKSSQNENNQ